MTREKGERAESRGEVEGEEGKGADSSGGGAYFGAISVTF